VENKFTVKLVRSWFTPGCALCLAQLIADAVTVGALFDALMTRIIEQESNAL
jgi:hypothetical protein